MPITKEIISKFDVTGPRYTSYPTAPEWSEEVREPDYQQKLTGFSQTDKTLSLYFHIPFCQSMCSFCACNVVIRQAEEKHGDEYLNYLLREMELVSQWLGSKPKVRQLHWGGGTPTFLTERQIERLFNKTKEYFDIDFNGEIAIEIDPRTIDKSKMKLLRSLGFNRVSMGVQDFDPKVQETVNRIQSFEMVKELTDQCRQLKFNSINFDLIYGLPYQTVESFKNTAAKVLALKPDRIALYNFAYVPWLKKHQTKISPDVLPTGDIKMDIFLYARQTLLNAGYEAIAMDHFALKDDELARAFRNGKLYRNFMGYTVKPADDYLGFGVSSIGFLENTYIQNHKALPDYYAALEKYAIPVERGKILSEDDIIRRWVINTLMCQFHVDKNIFKDKFDRAFDEYFSEETEHIKQCVQDDLLVIKNERLEATEQGKIFIRNICMGFDWYLRQQGAHKQFSRTV